MGEEFDARDQYGNRYKARRAGGGGNAVDKYGNRYSVRHVGDGCFTGLAFWLMAAALVIAVIVAIFAGGARIIGNWIFSPYHVFTDDHNTAVRTAVQWHVGTDKYAGLWETDTGTRNDDSHFSNVTLDPELGGFPGKAYTVDAIEAKDSSSWFAFENVSISREGHCLLIVYINPTPGVQHTIFAQVSDNGQNQAYTFHIQPGADSGSVDIGWQGRNPADPGYYYTISIRGDVGTPFEAIVVDRSGQETSSASSTQTKPTPTPTPIRLASKYSGTWVNPSYGGDFGTEQAVLVITKTNADGSFEGKLYDTEKTDSYGSRETNIYGVQGVSVPFDKINRFSQIDSAKVQDLVQHVGDNGVLLQFTVKSFINDTGNNVTQCGADNYDSGCVGFDFYGTLSGGSVIGVWWRNNGTNETLPSYGTFTLSS